MAFDKAGQQHFPLQVDLLGGFADKLGNMHVVADINDFVTFYRHRLLRLMRWREAFARERDLPKNWVIDQPLALQVAQRPPEDFAALLIHRLGRLPSDRSSIVQIRLGEAFG